MSSYFPYISSVFPTLGNSNERRRVEIRNPPKELPDSGLGTQNMERIQKLTERRLVFGGRWFRTPPLVESRIEKAEEDAGNQVGKTSAELQTYKLRSWLARKCCHISKWQMFMPPVSCFFFGSSHLHKTHMSETEMIKQQVQNRHDECLEIQMNESLFYFNIDKILDETAAKVTTTSETF